MPVLQLRPRSGGAAQPGAPASARFIKRLAGGGLLGAIGNAFAQYVPPIKVPVPNVQMAAPVDVAGAWAAADKAGADVGAKAVDGYTTSMKQAFDKAEIAAAYRTEHAQNNARFLARERDRLASDPAAYNSPAVQKQIELDAQQLNDPGKLAAQTNEFKQWKMDEEQLSKNNQLGQVAFDMEGNPLDKTYGEMFSFYATEQNPDVHRQFFPSRRNPDGTSSSTAHRLTLPSGKGDEARAELKVLEDKITPWSKEVGSTGFSEASVGNIQAMYQKVGGDAAGIVTTGVKSKETENLRQINAITKQLATGNTWRTLLSPPAAQQLLAEQYQAVTREPANFGATLKEFGVKNGVLPLEAGNYKLGSNHLDARDKITDLLRNAQLGEKDRDTLLKVYATLRSYDLQKAEQNVRNTMIERLNLQKFYDKSDVTTKSLSIQTDKPAASNKGDKSDLLNNIMHGSGLEMVSPSTQYEDGTDPSTGKAIKKDGMGFWSTNLSVSPDFKDIMANLTLTSTPTGGTTNRTLGDIAATGGVIYNAHTLQPMTSGGPVTDNALSNIKVVPGNGQVVYLPRNPADKDRLRTRIRQSEKETNEVNAQLAPLVARAQAGEKLAGAELQKAQRLVQRQEELSKVATQEGLTAFVRLTAVGRNNHLEQSNAFKQSVKGHFNPDEVLGRGFMYHNATARLFNNKQFDKAKTGLESVSSSEAENYGLKDEVGIDDLVKFDVFVPLTNIHEAGSRESQIDNTDTFMKVQQQETKQGMSRWNNAGANHLR